MRQRWRADNADLPEYREFYAGFYQGAAFMVHRAGRGLAARSGDECESGCDPADDDPGGYAGKGVFLQEYTAVFYDPVGLLSRRLSGG